MINRASLFLEKARESLDGAESEVANRRYNNAANRAYYACFQAAVAALIETGIRPPGSSERWGHDFVGAQFNGELVNRRKRYAAELRGVIDRAEVLRVKADYNQDVVTQTEASRIVRRSRELVAAVSQRTGGTR